MEVQEKRRWRRRAGREFMTGEVQNVIDASATTALMISATMVAEAGTFEKRGKRGHGTFCATGQRGTTFTFEDSGGIL